MKRNEWNFSGILLAGPLGGLNEVGQRSLSFLPATGLQTTIGVDEEERLGKDQRSLLSVEGQYRDQLTERNTLLLTIYQYMDKILGVDKTPVSICSSLVNCILTFA